MKTDLYTKSILTVIAVALSIIALRQFPAKEAHAAGADFNKFASVPVNDDGSINVKILSSDMDVNIRSIGGSSIYGALPINLKEIGGSSFYGALPVNFKELGGSSISSSGIPVNIEAVDGISVYSAIPVKDVK